MSFFKNLFHGKHDGPLKRTHTRLRSLNQLSSSLIKTSQELSDEAEEDLETLADLADQAFDVSDDFIDMSSSKKTSHKKKKKQSIPTIAGKIVARLFIVGLTIGLLGIGGLLVYIATLEVPDLQTFHERKVASSTKIYDRTGEIVLYDVFEDVDRTVVKYDDISQHVIDAIIAIEDQHFYEHNGIVVRSTIRGILYTGLSFLGVDGFSQQGGSTITQQLVKNTILEPGSSFRAKANRKLKEWFLAPKLESELTKEQILEFYLNESPFGGTIYGVETASQAFFNKPAIDVTIKEAAYLAAIPNAPSLFSPYKEDTSRLEARTARVLQNMKSLGYITEEEFNTAMDEEVVFWPEEEGYAKAIHFVEYVREQLDAEYGEDVVNSGGLQVITTLDYELQQEAERIIREHALLNEEAWGASNAGMVAIDPTTGHILAMVGSRGWADEDIDGKFNITTAKRQPGSSFKPFIYATAFEQGYTDDTILFDVPTQFTESCDPTEFTGEGDCYSPKNYDGEFKGPLTIRQALGQSRNIPAVKALYLVGGNESLATARNMGISTLNRKASHYGLSLVLGGGEVTLLEMTSAYGTFANDGERNEPVSIVKVSDLEDNVLEEHKPSPNQAISKYAARTVNDVLSDNQARTPLFGSNSFMYFGNSYDVAAKTGTTNNNRDAWLVGYSPKLAVGVWSGNNDNSPMRKGSSISGQPWREFMNVALPKVDPQGARFIPPTSVPISELKPVMRGVWKGGDSIFIDTVSGKLATQYTPEETKKEIVNPSLHSILHWVQRGNPRGPIPENPQQNSLYTHWEAGVYAWLVDNIAEILPDMLSGIGVEIPTEEDDVHVPERFPIIENITVSRGTLSVDVDGYYNIEKVQYFANGEYLGESTQGPSYSFTTMADIDGQTITAVAIDEVWNRGEKVFEN